jgi:hypothetical protein
VFEDALQISKGMYCVPHLERNIRQHKGTQAEKVLEKNFPANALFHLQASHTSEQDMFLWDMASISISVPLCNCCCIEAGTVC